MEFEPNHRNSQCRAKCCAIGCKSKMNINQNLSFHRLPKSGMKVRVISSSGKKEVVDKRSEWLRSLGLETFTKSAVVCSKHFDPSDFYLPLNELNTKRRLLKPDAIPTYINTTKNGEQPLLRLERKRRQFNAPLPTENRTLMEEDNSECVREDLNLSDEPIMEDLNALNVSETIIIGQVNHDHDCEVRLTEELCDNETELSSEFVEGIDSSISQNICNGIKAECPAETLSSFIKSKADLKSMCNMSFEILDKLTVLLDEFYPFEEKQLLSNRDCIILTTAKLKLDIPFNALAIFYKSVSEGYVRKTFYITVKKLAAILQLINKRVTKEGIGCNTPEYLGRETTSILNCTEVKIKKPRCLKCQTKFHSYFKDKLRVKFITEVTPGGLITFISKSFVDGASNEIRNHSKISQYLESRKDVLLDQELFVDEEYIQEKVHILKLPLIKKEDPDSNETMKSRNITKARIHIERINQQVRQFKILENKIPLHMINYVEQIFMTCCGLTTLNLAVLANEEF